MTRHSIAVARHPESLSTPPAKQWRRQEHLRFSPREEAAGMTENSDSGLYAPSPRTASAQAQGGDHPYLEPEPDPGDERGSVKCFSPAFRKIGGPADLPFPNKADVRRELTHNLVAEP